MSTTRPVRRLLALAVTACLLAGLAPMALPGGVAGVVLGPPTLTSPANGDMVTGNPVFAWAAVPSAVKYRIAVSTVDTFASTVVAEDTQNLRSTPISELPLGTLYWRVAALDAGNTVGTYATGTFVKNWGAVPNPLTPADFATLTFPTDPLLFTWDPLAGAQSYELQVDDDPQFVGAVTLTTKNTSFVITEPKTSGQTFYWHVRAVSGGIFSNWSAYRELTVAWPSVPSLAFPADSAQITDIYLDWAPVPGAKNYQLQVSPNGDWANNVVIDEIVKSTRYAPPTTLNNANYFWRVRAKDAAGTPNNGGWSAERQFQRSWLDRPTLLAPADGNYAVPVPTFSWTPVTHASHYQLEYSTDINFLAVDGTCYTNHTSVTPYSGASGAPGACTLSPVPGTLYYWRVRGIDAPKGVLGLWSSTSTADLFRFVYMPTASAYVAPANGATVDTPSLSWSAVPGVERYKVTILKSSGATAASATTYSTSWTPTTALSPTDSPFKWYVQTYDFADRLSLIPAADTFRSFTLTAPPAPTEVTPAPTGPADGASSYRMPAMAWSPVIGAARYRVIYGVAGTDIYNATPLGTTDYAEFTYATAVLSPGTYSWYVEATNGSGTVIASSYDARRTFVISELGLLSPADYVTPAKCLPGGGCAQLADTPTLHWNDVPNAGYYLVYLAQDPNFTNIYRTYDTSFTELTPRESFLDNQAGQAYYWFVRPVASDNSGRFDSVAQQNASAFQKRSEGIHRAAPLDDAHVADEITFAWEDFLVTNQGLTPPVSQEAKEYRIQVSLVADFASIFDTMLVDQPFYTPSDTTYPEGPIYWRVEATDGSNNPLTYSSAGLVWKDSPRVGLSYPSDGASVPGVPYLQWNPQDYAASYDVQLDTDVNFSSPTTTTTKMTAWAYTEPLAAATYYWRVRRNDADARDGPWSLVRSFVLAPAAPTLTSPTNGANPSPTTLLLQWTSSRPAPKYSVALSTSATFATQLSGYPLTTVMSSWAPKTLLVNGTYYWRVNALNAAGTVVATSATFSFTIDSTRPSVTALSPASAAAITSSFTVTFSEPVFGVSGTTFVVTIAGTSTTVPGTVSVLSSTSAQFTPASLLVPGQTYAVALSTGITDSVGNPLLPYSSNVRTSTAVQQDSPAIREAWGRWTTGSASGGAMKISRTGSARLTFTFTGSTISLVGYRGPTGGYASIYLDGVLQTSVLSFYASSNQYRRTLWSKGGLAAGPHTIQVLPRGTKPRASKDTWVYVDAFVVDGVTVQESNPGVTERFRRVATASASGSAYDVTSHVAATGRAGATLTFQFRGTGISWYGTKGSTYGKAYVYIDNVKKATIDLYRSGTAYRQRLWTSATLSNAVHTIKVVVVGTKRTAAKGYDVSFDYFAIK